MNTRCLCCVLFLFHALAAQAGWTELAADQVAREYVNLDTVSQEGNIISMWNMSDFHALQPVGNGRMYQSSRVLQQYDCIAKKKRIVTLIHYADAMGKGQLVFYDKTPSEWRDVAAGSLGEIHYNAACLTSMHTKNNPNKVL